MEGAITMINKIIIFLTFIPWIVIYLKYCLSKLSDNNKLSIKYLKSNIFKIFRLDLLVLIIIFFYYASFNKGFVNEYLFAVFNIYLFVNSFYENHNIKKGMLKKEIFPLIIMLILMIIPIIYYIFSKNLILTYKVMFIYLFLENIVVLIFKNVKRLVLEFL